MKSIPARGLFLLSVVLAVGSAACTGGADPAGGSSSGSSTTDAGTSSADASGADSPRATPQAIVDGIIESGTGNDCPSAGELFDVGDFGDPSGTPPVPAKPIKDGESFAEGIVNVTCSVVRSAAASEHQVNASVTLSGANGGHMEIAGTFASMGDQANIRMTASRGVDGTTYEDSSCTARYTTPFQGVAPGRVWAEITCPNATSNGQGSCELLVQLRLENCASE